MTTSILFAAVFLVTFLVTVLVSKKLIPILKSKKMGQKILDIGPRWHKSKEGTPTMGGIAFIAAILLSGIAACVWIGVRDGIRAALPLAFTLALGLAGGLIGCVDDLAKLRKKQNEGLTAAQKFLLQVLAAGLYLFGMAMVRRAEGLPSVTEIYFPFLGKSVDFGLFYYLIALLLLVG
ncbi:MAG: phospho-N-acetylmuramoyl-pentapeptide-transferase, partial [Clostridia bacterium]|nr:phospho-N-acetylmuramoyl-pentapeptide-transferase [Clostridia bacterium]